MICIICERDDLTEDDFHKNGKWFRSECKPCRNDKRRETYIRNKNKKLNKVISMKW